MNKKAIYPGSFNPFHIGHQKIVEKALKLFDFIYIIVSVNPDKNIENNFEENQKIIQSLYKDNPKILVLINKNELIAEIAKKLKVNFIIRSFRNNFDFDYELDLAFSNNKLNNDLETILLMPDLNFLKKSSTIQRHKKYLEDLKK
ncbi:MAG: pantetheine-phosphate adenylyltransferase [Metamycoplasmataceae bacterium]